VEQQKLTLPLIRALAELPAEDAEQLRFAIRRGAASEVADALIATGTIKSVEQEARRLSAAARRALSVLPASPYRTALEQVAEWAVKRSN